jgi:hypothetical protein
MCEISLTIDISEVRETSSQYLCTNSVTYFSLLIGGDVGAKAGCFINQMFNQPSTRCDIS